MTARSAPQVVSSRIRERQTAASTASMPNPRPWRRGQAPKPHRGAPKAQGLTAAIAVAGPSPVPSIAPDDPVSLNSTGADVPMCAFATSRIYTSLTGTTPTHSSDVLIDKAGHELVRLKYIAGMFFKDLCGDLDDPPAWFSTETRSHHATATSPGLEPVRRPKSGCRTTIPPARPLCWRPLPRLAPDFK